MASTPSVSLVEQASCKAKQVSSETYDIELINESLDFEPIDDLDYVNRKKNLLTQDDALNLQCDCRKQFDDEEICADERCINYSSRTECPLGTCSKRRCQNKRFQKRQWKEVEVTPVCLFAFQHICRHHTQASKIKGKRRKGRTEWNRTNSLFLCVHKISMKHKREEKGEEILGLIC